MSDNKRERVPAVPIELTGSPSTPTERGDTDLAGSASSLARQNAPRYPNRGQARDEGLPGGETDPVGLKGVDDGK